MILQRWSEWWMITQPGVWWSGHSKMAMVELTLSLRIALQKAVGDITEATSVYDGYIALKFQSPFCWMRTGLCSVIVCNPLTFQGSSMFTHLADQRFHPEWLWSVRHHFSSSEVDLGLSTEHLLNNIHTHFTPLWQRREKRPGTRGPFCICCTTNSGTFINTQYYIMAL